jgi:LacI family transcriptional regulator
MPARRTARTTISDVAEKVGLTKGTVSRALNGYPDISDRTRHRVMRAAEDMGYSPLAHAQAIKTGRVRSIGLVLQVSEHDAHGPFLTDFLAGVTTAASDESWTLAVATASSDADMINTIERLVSEHKADGFILPRTLSQDPRASCLTELGVPFILFGRMEDTTGCSWFDILGEEAMRQAVLRLHDLGHRRIGFVNGGDEYHFARLRHQGYLEGLAAVGLKPDPALTRHNVRLTSDGKAATLDLMCQPEPPTAIVFATDELALGAYHAAPELGIDIGQDLSVIAYDGIPEGLYASPPLTTFSVDMRGAGRTLASLLIRQIRGEAPEDLRETAQAQLVIQGSDGPPVLTPTALAEKIARATTELASKGGQR